MLRLSITFKAILAAATLACVPSSAFSNNQFLHTPTPLSCCHEGIPGLQQDFKDLSMRSTEGKHATTFRPAAKGDDTDVSPSVFLLTIPRIRTSGTAFVVRVGAKPYLLSAKHVCMRKQVHLHPIKVRNRSASYAVKIAKVSRLHDLCLLALPKSFNLHKHPPFAFAESDFQSGMELFGIGYPKTANQVRALGSLISISPQVTHVESIWGVEGRTTFAVVPGMSGGPVLNSKGEIVGVIFGYYVIDPFHRGIFVPINHILEFINATGFN